MYIELTTVDGIKHFQNVISITFHSEKGNFTYTNAQDIAQFNISYNAITICFESRQETFGNHPMIGTVRG